MLVFKKFFLQHNRIFSQYCTTTGSTNNINNFLSPATLFHSASLSHETSTKMYWKVIFEYPDKQSRGQSILQRYRIEKVGQAYGRIEFGKGLNSHSRSCRNASATLLSANLLQHLNHKPGKYLCLICDWSYWKD